VIEQPLSKHKNIYALHDIWPWNIFQKFFHISAFGLSRFYLINAYFLIFIIYLIDLHFYVKNKNMVPYHTWCYNDQQII